MKFSTSQRYFLNMECLDDKEPLSENEEETLVGEVIGEVGEIAYWKAKAEEWRNVALESRLELEEFQNESRYKTHSILPILVINDTQSDSIQYLNFAKK